MVPFFTFTRGTKIFFNLFIQTENTVCFLIELVKVKGAKFCFGFLSPIVHSPCIKWVQIKPHVASFLKGLEIHGGSGLIPGTVVLNDELS